MQDGDSYTTEIHTWQAEREKKLRGERGWLSLVGRFPLKPGQNTIGLDSENDIVLPKEFTADVPQQLGTISLNAPLRTVELQLNSELKMFAGENQAFQGKRAFQLDAPQRDWVWLGRLSMHVMLHNGEYFLRIADAQAKTRLDFPGCSWYPVNPDLRVEAKFVPHATEKLLPFPSILGDVTQESSPGFAEFTIQGTQYRLDAIQAGEGLFFVFRDETAGDTTYSAARFIDIDHQPAANANFVLDFNKAYNPPCAFSKFTVCPLPPRQNILAVRIEAGETLQ